MKFNKQSSSLRLFKLAFSSARFDLRRILVALSLILIFVMGSLYIINQVYRGDGPVSNNTTKLSKKNQKKKPTAKSKSKTVVQPVSISPELLQKSKQRSVARLKSKLQAQAITGSKRKKYQRGEWISKDAEEKLKRHKSILAHSGEVAKLRRQDQPLYSGNPSLSPTDDEEEYVPPPPKPKPGFWSEVGSDFVDVLKDILK